jgi:undecaprenyl-diphosphatase
MRVDLLVLAKAAVLGIIQGLTEFLPISSTAHLLISERLLGFVDDGGVFTVMIQLGSILAVMWLYRAKILEVVIGLPTKPEARRFAFMLIAAFLPALLAGLFLADFVKSVLYESFFVIAVAFIAGGVVMLLLERFKPTPVVMEADQTPVGRAFGIGIFQTLALIPGVSRSGATIVGGLFLGLDRRAAAEFSFFLAMPTMAAAFVHDLIKVKDDLSAGRAEEIAIGFVFAFLASWVVVKPFLGFVSRAGFAPFAYYRIAAGIAVLAALHFGML